MLVDTLTPKQAFHPLSWLSWLMLIDLVQEASRKYMTVSAEGVWLAHNNIYHTSRMPGPQNYGIYQILELQCPGFFEASNLDN